LAIFEMMVPVAVSITLRRRGGKERVKERV